MYKRCALFFFMLAFGLCNHLRVLGQQKIADTAFLHLITANMADHFYKAIGQQARLYNGPAVDPYHFISNTNPNFKDTTTYNDGNVTYDGIAYTHVPLLYNIDRDLLITHLYSQFGSFSLISVKVTDFDLLGHHFIRLASDSLHKLTEAGFYDELYVGKMSLFARRTKNIQSESNSKGIGQYFVEKTTYYLKKGALYYEVNSQAKFLDVLKDRKKEIKQFIKDSKLRYRDNPEYAMARIAAYYDHLTN